MTEHPEIFALTVEKQEYERRAANYIADGSPFAAIGAKVVIANIEAKIQKLRKEAEVPEVATDAQVNHPAHYNQHPSGVECIEIVRHMTFNVGNVFKYLWRSGLKDSEPVLKDFKKALWYLQDEIARIEKLEGKK